MELSSDLELDIPNMCRVCLLQKEKLNNIFSNCIVEGYVISLPEIIKSCLDLYLQKDDKNLPKKICDLCKIQVINFYSFKEKSKKVEEALKNLLSSTRLKSEGSPQVEILPNSARSIKIENSTDVVEYDEQELLEEHDENSTMMTEPLPTVEAVYPQEQFQYSNSDQTECNVKFDQTECNVIPGSEMCSAKIESIESHDETLDCEELVEEREEIEEMEEDLREEDLREDHELQQDALIEPSEVVDNLSNACNMCDKKYETVNNLKRHLDKHNGIFFKCRLCPKMYAHQASRNRHMRLGHPKQVNVIMLQTENPFQRNDPVNPPIKINVGENLQSKRITRLSKILDEKNSDTCDLQPDLDVEQNEAMVDDLECLCTICDANFETERMFVEHSKFEHPDVFCGNCSKLFLSSEERNKHMSQEHFYESSNSKLSNITCDNFCRFCQKKFKSVIELNTHRELHETLNKWMGNAVSPMVSFFACYKCNTVFLSEQSLQGHTVAKHSESPKKINLDDDSIDCTDYQFLDDDEAAMVAQSSLQTEEPFNCGVCNVELFNENEMRNHIIIHSNKLSCPFDECGCEYNSFSRFSLHLIHRHLNRDVFKCMHCGESYQSYDDLQNHIKKTCPERKYNCNHCDKSFFSVKALSIHMKTSIEKKTILCQTCGKSFTHSGELKIHSRTHTGERPYKCNICGKAYKTASMRTAHMDAHIQGKTFLCTICDKKLQTRTSFRTHMRRHTEDKKHQCEICLKKFFTKYHAKLHTMKIHDNPNRIQNKNAASSMQV